MLVEPLNAVRYNRGYHLPGCKPFNIAEEEIVKSLLAAKAIKVIGEASEGDDINTILGALKKIPGVSGKIADKLIAFGIYSIELLKENLDILVEIDIAPKTITKIRQHFEKEKIIG